MQLLPILTAVAEQSIPGRPATWQESLRLMGAGWGIHFHCDPCHHALRLFAQPHIPQ